MNYLAKLDNDTIDAAIKGLWENSNILVGIGELLQSTSEDPCLGEEAMYGLGQLISRVGKSVRNIKDDLEYGDDTDDADDGENDAEPEDAENTTKQVEKTPPTDFAGLIEKLIPILKSASTKTDTEK